MGPGYAYYMGWFTAVIYTPCLVSALAWISARYFCVLLGWDITGGACMTIAGAMLCLDHVLNALAPRLAGKLQVSATVIKMIPLALMAVCGAASGAVNGRLLENFATGAVTTGTAAGSGLMASTVAVAFAYEGWILATSINAELKDAKRTLPKALVAGSLIVVATYILYYIGLNGAVTHGRADGQRRGCGQDGLPAGVRHGGGHGGVRADRHLLPGDAERPDPLLLPGAVCPGGPRGGPGAEAVPPGGPGDGHVRHLLHGKPGHLGRVAGVLLRRQCGRAWFGPFSFDSSELPIITLYAMYVPMFIQLMRRGTDLGVFRRFVMPALALCGCGFMVYAAFAGYGVTVFYYLIVFAVLMLAGSRFRGKKVSGKKGFDR